MKLFFYLSLLCVSILTLTIFDLELGQSQQTLTSIEQIEQPKNKHTQLEIEETSDVQQVVQALMKHGVELKEYMFTKDTTAQAVYTYLVMGRSNDVIRINLYDTDAYRAAKIKERYGNLLEEVDAAENTRVRIYPIRNMAVLYYSPVNQDSSVATAVEMVSHQLRRHV